MTKSLKKRQEKINIKLNIQEGWSIKVTSPIFPQHLSV